MSVQQSFPNLPTGYLNANLNASGKVVATKGLATNGNKYTRLTNAQLKAANEQGAIAIANVNNKLQQQRRQIQGSEFDIDAVTDLFVDIQRHLN